MAQKVYNIGNSLKHLTDDELSRLFYVCRENVDLLLKVMPGHEWLTMVKKDQVNAYKGLFFARDLSRKNQ